ncbi:hypothetical protein DPX16_10317 [Anabarilius grahami]|uniref:Uncharacterized protein n=1 Tax=Anabarilius grahami TaxID=495550 RepID=A0A3N0YCS9_ANAGA|nr:hypothetical protein DPX16_10317 [Anabarilius grahami]
MADVSGLMSSHGQRDKNEVIQNGREPEEDHRLVETEDKIKSEAKIFQEAEQNTFHRRGRRSALEDPSTLSTTTKKRRRLLSAEDGSVQHHPLC